jgi:hypothetical protein
MANITISNVTGLLPASVYVADEFGENSQYVGQLTGTPQTFSVTGCPVNTAFLVVTIVNGAGNQQIQIVQCSDLVPTPSVTPTKTVTPTVTPTKTLTPSVTPTITPTSVTPSVTPTYTPTPSVTSTPCPPPDFAYLFIEPVSASTSMYNWMNSQGQTWYGFNFSNPTQNQTTFNTQFNTYVNFSGWTAGTMPAVRTQTIPQVSGGFDVYGNEIFAYNFTTHRVPSGTGPTGSQYAWYTWVIPPNATNNLKQTQIGFNYQSDPLSLVVANMENTVYDYTFNYTGNTIPKGIYRVYTTSRQPHFRLNNNLDIYFKGITVS